MMLSRCFAVLLPLLLAAGCSRENASAASASSSPSSAAAASGAPAPATAELDPRRPLPLLAIMAEHQKQNMREHLVAVQRVVGALATGDLAGVERAASALGSSAQMSQTCHHLGAAAPGFTEQALAFHRTADGIASAARSGSAESVLAALSATLETCTGCHAVWKQQVVTPAELQALSAAAPSHH